MIGRTDYYTGSGFGNAAKELCGSGFHRTRLEAPPALPPLGVKTVQFTGTRPSIYCLIGYGQRATGRRAERVPPEGPCRIEREAEHLPISTKRVHSTIVQDWFVNKERFIGIYPLVSSTPCIGQYERLPLTVIDVWGG